MCQVYPLPSESKKLKPYADNTLINSDERYCLLSRENVIINEPKRWVDKTFYWSVLYLYYKINYTDLSSLIMFLHLIAPSTNRKLCLLIHSQTFLWFPSGFSAKKYINIWHENTLKWKYLENILDKNKNSPIVNLNIQKYSTRTL